MEDRAAVEQTLREVFGREHPGIVAAYLFGSVARGTPRRGSDVDLIGCRLHVTPSPR